MAWSKDHPFRGDPYKLIRIAVIFEERAIWSLYGVSVYSTGVCPDSIWKCHIDLPKSCYDSYHAPCVRSRFSFHKILLTWRISTNTNILTQTSFSTRKCLISSISATIPVLKVYKINKKSRHKFVLKKCWSNFY